jgi:hypothetical protein
MGIRKPAINIGSAVVVVALLITACSGDHQDPESGGPSTADRVQRCLGDEVDTVASDVFGGLTQDEARRQAETFGLTFRVLGRDGACLGRDEDLRFDRLNVVLREGKVVEAARF